MKDKETSLHSLRFGYSTDKKTLQTITKTVEKVFYLLLTVVGTASFTYAGAFASSAPSIFSANDKGAWHGIESFSGLELFFEVTWILISHPILHFLYAIILLYIGLSGTNKDYENLDKKSQALAKQLLNQNDIRERLTFSQEEIAKLNGKLREKHEELVKTWLKGSFSHLMNDNNAAVQENTHARVSIYYVYDDHFYMLARYSPNAEYDRVHRQKFSMGKGIIYQIYQHLEVHEKFLVEHEQANPTKYYEKIESKYGYKQEQLEKFNMKSCRYFGRAIREADITIGIILFESTKADDLKEDLNILEIRSYFEKNWGHLCQFVRHGIEHDITSRHHENLRTDQDVLGKLYQPTAEEEILAELQPEKVEGQ